jgi:putative ABC transport system permease protein
VASFRKYILRLRGLINKRRKDWELDEEIESHLQMHIEDNLRLGMTPEEARREAMIKLGGIESMREAYRDQRGLPVLETFWQDVRYGARMLWKNAGFTAVAVMTLALGIGANTAIFSLIRAALLRELPFPEDSRLAVVWAANPRKPGMEHVPLANSDIAELRDRNQSFARIAAFLPRSVDLTEGDNDPERIGGAGVTAGFFETLGIAPLLGRTLTAEEETFGGPPVALISYGLWQRRFGGDRALLGKSISIDGEKRAIIGILPPEFDFPRGAEWPAFFPFAGRTEIWLPLGMRAQNDNSGWSYWQSPERMLVMIGRLKAGITQRQAQAEMDAFTVRQASDHPDTHKDAIVKVISLREQLSGKLRTALVLLFAAAGLLLLIACTNVANLLLARGVARQQEMAVRIALGARRRRLTRQLLTEGFLLATLGSGCALLVAEGCLKTFLALNPMTASRLDQATLDPVVLGFTALVALATSAVFGLAPALQTARSDLRKSLQESGRDGSGAARGNARAWLVGTEVALALVLLTTAGLMVRSFMRVMAVQTGFRPESVLAFDVGLPSARYGNDASQIRFFQQLTERLESLPGARASAAISYLPLGGGENMGRFTIEGEVPPSPANEPFAERRWVTPGYFAAMGIPIRRGRVFTPRDSADQPKVVVINETLAKQFFSGRDPVGERLKAGGAVRTIVGVVSDVRSSSLESEIRPQFYVPNAQWGWGAMTIVLHTEGDPLALASAARGELKALDPLVPAANLRSMQQVVSSASSARRFNMALLVFFALVALLLTMMGIYGVVAFLVGRRAREIGVRLALGAQRGEVIRMVLRQGMKPILFGSAVGIIGSLATARLLQSQLFGVSPFDPLTLGIIFMLLFTAGLLACWVPARRAAKVDPMVALRYE